jgi:hypothetical protein
MQMYTIKFCSEGNVLPTTHIVISANSPSEALDGFWCWMRLQPWYMHTWTLNISMEEILHIDSVPEAYKTKDHAQATKQQR